MVKARSTFLNKLRQGALLVKGGKEFNQGIRKLDKSDLDTVRTDFFAGIQRESEVVAVFKQRFINTTDSDSDVIERPHFFVFLG
jgi:phage-related protein